MKEISFTLRFKVTLLALFWLTSCSLYKEVDQTSSVPLPSDLLSEDESVVRSRWIKNVQNKKFHGEADIWAGGPLSMFLAFDQNTGDLWDAMKKYDSDMWYVLHKIVYAVNENLIIAQVVPSASGTLAGTLYSLELKPDGSLWRTASGWGASKNNDPPSRSNPGWRISDLSPETFHTILAKLTNINCVEQIGIPAADTDFVIDTSRYPNLPK